MVDKIKRSNERSKRNKRSNINGTTASNTTNSANTTRKEETKNTRYMDKGDRTSNKMGNHQERILSNTISAMEYPNNPRNERQVNQRCRDPRAK